MVVLARAASALLFNKWKERQGLNSRLYGEERCGHVSVLGKQIGSLVFRSTHSHYGEPATWMGLAWAPGPIPASSAIRKLSQGLAFLSDFLSVLSFAMVFGHVPL